MNKIKPIETRYDGILFRSRTEARWAVFFNTIGFRYEYEKEGYALKSGWYLPDFYLPDIGYWLEVKGEEPTAEEVCRCGFLFEATGKPVLIAPGAPQPSDHLIHVPFKSDQDGCRYYFADDRKIDGSFWLICDDAGAYSIHGSASDRYPSVCTATQRGYAAARSARFERQLA